MPNELIICGWDEVYILDLRPGASPAKVWSWRAADSRGVPEALRSRFRTTDDCKPVDGERKVLITSSGGAVALVERATGETLFAAAAPNAHSAECLPDGRIAVAASVAPGGNALMLFDPEKPEAPVWSDPLYSGHGAVWDGDRGLLWALGDRVLQAYGIDGEVPARAFEVALPDSGGHDLFPVPGGLHMTLTTAKHVWLFDRQTHSFERYPGLGDTPDIKCMCVNPETGQLVYTQAERPNWWTERVRFGQPDGLLLRPGERLYKARWVACGR